MKRYEWKAFKTSERSKILGLLLSSYWRRLESIVHITGRKCLQCKLSDSWDIASWSPNSTDLYFWYLFVDQHRNTNMKNKDHLVGQLTTICGSTCDPRQTVRTSFDNLRRASFVISLAILVLLSRPTRDSRCSRWPRWLRRRCVQALGPRRPDTSGPLAATKLGGDGGQHARPATGNLQTKAK